MGEGVEELNVRGNDRGVEVVEGGVKRQMQYGMVMVW